MDKSHPFFKKTLEFLRKYKELEKQQQLLTKEFLESVDNEVSETELGNLDELLKNA